VTHGSFDTYDRRTPRKNSVHYERMGMKAYLGPREELLDVVRNYKLVEPGSVRAGDW
jgi:hypothetical protein